MDRTAVEHLMLKSGGSFEGSKGSFSARLLQTEKGVNGLKKIIYTDMLWLCPFPSPL